LLETIKTDVVIVGGGPTGLSLACQLVRHGVDFVVVEKNEGVTKFSKALGVQARTLEIYEQMGLAERAVGRGEISDRVQLLANGEVRGQMFIGEIGKGLSPYPYLLFLEQSKNEELLYEYLRGRGKDVLWQAELESFSQDGAGVTASIKTAGGETRTVEAKYLVGCDGASSRVRHELGLRFEGSTFERLFFVADARVEWALPHGVLQVALARDVFTAFFPMKGEGRYRIIGTFPEGVNKEAGEVAYEEIERQIKSEAHIPLDITEVNWFSLYKVHSRRVNKFSEGRCFVAGDAAHIHSPVGAQGMNTGIQDAYNLAWKLALVVKGLAGERLLETYDEERSKNAQRLLETTDRLFELAAGPNPLLSLIRTTVFPRVAGQLVKIKAVRKRMFRLVSQIAINYRGGSLSDGAGGDRFEVKAGDRMPYFLVDGRSVYDSLREPKFHLLTFSDETGGGPDAGDALAGVDPRLFDRQRFPLRGPAAEVFGADAPFTVLLRPDNHVARISPGVSTDGASAYLRGLAG
jgi:2-polyprenyl-6-methoxyphenol hydroxylase-like FAD-dependent oxidoreductase